MPIAIPYEEDEASYLDAGIEPSVPTYQRIWQDNKGAFLILLSCVTGSSMDAIARVLQQGEGGMHSFQIIVARMGITFVLCILYMWWKEVPDFPLGIPQIRGWLILRALSGFMGLFCLYYSVHYLPLAEATVFRFLVPIITALACWLCLGEVFTSRELFAGLLALIGVVIIAHPASVFANSTDPSASQFLHILRNGNVEIVTPRQRLIAVAVATIGIFGASSAYTTIRVIGRRAHALISVAYFALLSTVAAALFLIFLPDIHFVMPPTALSWYLTVAMGVLGFVLQFLLTAGLQLDRSSKATSMLYSQIVFALIFDFAIWGNVPEKWSLIGGSVVIGSTLWSALQDKEKMAAVRYDDDVVDEESALLGARNDQMVDTIPRRGSVGE